MCILLHPVTRRHSSRWARQSALTAAWPCRLPSAAATQSQLLNHWQALPGAASVLRPRRRGAPWTLASPAWLTSRSPACHCAPPPTPAGHSGGQGDAGQRRGRGSGTSGGGCWSGPPQQRGSCNRLGTTRPTLQEPVQRGSGPQQRRHHGPAPLARTLAVAGADKYCPMSSQRMGRARAAPSAQTVWTGPSPPLVARWTSLHAAQGRPKPQRRLLPSQHRPIAPCHFICNWVRPCRCGCCSYGVPVPVAHPLDRSGSGAQWNDTSQVPPVPLPTLPTRWAADRHD